MQKISNINIRVNDDLKKQSSDLFEYFGMSLSQAITLFLKQAVNTSSIPFEIKAPQFSDEMMESIKEADEMKKHPEKYKSYTSVEELMENIHTES